MDDLSSNNTKRFFLVLVISVAWLAAPIIVTLVVRANAIAGVYGIEDAIFIPIALAIGLWVVGLPYFGALSYAAFKRYQPGYNPLRMGSTREDVRSVLLILPGIALLAAVVAYWWSGPHLPIAITYVVPILWLFWIRPLLAKPQRASS